MNVIRFTGLLAAAAAFTTGCATTGATFRSGVGDAMLDKAPYYAGASRLAVGTSPARLAHLPIVFQRGATQPPIFDPADGAGTAMDALLRDMNAYLDSLGMTQVATVRLLEAGRTMAPAIVRGAPDVRFGCAAIPGDECPARGDSALGRGRQTMTLAVGRPSTPWVRWMQQTTSDAGIDRVLVITLEIGQYLTEQRGWRGTKHVNLGTNHTEDLPWLTSVETPVSVLQLTGAVIDTNGRAIRIGAEGILARRSRLAVSAFGAQELITDEDIESVRTLRRTDLAEQPLAWKSALYHLVTQLVARPVMAQAANEAAR